VGLDPLVKQYLELGADKHRMTYISGYSESIPFEDEHFDVICSFNSLDHVADLESTLTEIARVLKPGGLFLLLTELNHAPTPREPQTFDWGVTEDLQRHFEIIDERHYEKRSKGMYESIFQDIPYDHSDKSPRYGILSVKARKPAMP
jgi:ubiquinone/menaquinone biosynthesis C-methylase UbiE